MSTSFLAVGPITVSFLCVPFSLQLVLASFVLTVSPLKPLLVTGVAELSTPGTLVPFRDCRDPSPGL